MTRKNFIYHAVGVNFKVEQLSVDWSFHVLVGNQRYLVDRYNNVIFNLRREDSGNNGNDSNDNYHIIRSDNYYNAFLGSKTWFTEDGHLNFYDNNNFVKSLDLTNLSDIAVEVYHVFAAVEAYMAKHHLIINKN